MKQLDKPFELTLVGSQFYKLYTNAFILISFLFLVSMQVKNESNRKLLVGRWEGNSEGIKAVLLFKGNGTGVICYYPDKKEFRFKYLFKDDSTLVLIDEKNRNYHCIKKLDGNALQLRPYPTNTNMESISLIDEIDFKRIK